jgi:hypothetical protein
VGNRWPAKRWPEERFEALLRGASAPRRAGDRSRGTGEEATGRRIAAGARHAPGTAEPSVLAGLPLRTTSAWSPRSTSS